MAIISLWASMTAWFTPTVLFCATNLIIVIIFIASNNNNNKNIHHDDGGYPPTRISRVSSFLDRATSFKLSSSYSTTTTGSQHHYPSDSKTATYSSSSRLAKSIHLSSNSITPPPDLSKGKELYATEPEIEPPSQPAHTPSLFERVKSFRFSSVSTQPETVNPDPDPGHNPEHHAIRSKSENKSSRKKARVEMKKSRSEMKMTENDDDDVDLRRPATARVRGSNDVDEEVDAKADDFISRFKQQLKLQRLESLVRYNQMLKRSS